MYWNYRQQCRILPFAIVLTLIVVGLVVALAPHRPLAAGVARTGATGMADLSLPAQTAIAAALGRDDSTYHATARGQGLGFANPRHGLAADFTQTGIDVRSGEARWGLALLGYGYGDDLRAGGVAVPQAAANRVEYRRGVLTEWYVNGPLGLEQGFTLERAPGPHTGVALTMALTLAGDVTAVLDPDAGGVTLRRAGGAALRYAGCPPPTRPAASCALGWSCARRS